MPGYIYAVEFENGIVKVGQTSSLDERFKAYQAQSKCYGTRVNETWQAWVEDPSAGERRLMELAADYGASLHAGREWFTDASFDHIVRFADEEFGGWCPHWNHEHPHPTPDEMKRDEFEDLEAYDPEVFYTPAKRRA